MPIPPIARGNVYSVIEDLLQPDQTRPDQEILIQHGSRSRWREGGVESVGVVVVTADDETCEGAERIVARIAY